MTTEVIILAQGTQKRMGLGAGHKQLLPLPACGNTPILVRTLWQLERQHHDHTPLHVTIVTWRDLYTAIETEVGVAVDMVQLPDPGNSSLRGIARYLQIRGHRHRFDATIVLLGDVVYSWQCLKALWAACGDWGFVGTTDLAEGGGELWGVAWNRQHEADMLEDLADALLRHPPFEDEYQPGQLRRWIMGMRRGALATHVASLTHKAHYTAIDDYTMDVDVPTDVPKLGPTSVVAAKDDALHGLHWEGA